MHERAIHPPSVVSLRREHLPKHMAEAIFNAHPPPGWRAESAGVKPADNVNPVAVKLLEEIDIQVVHGKPRFATPALVAEASLIIAFGCLGRCPIDEREKTG